MSLTSRGGLGGGAGGAPDDASRVSVWQSLYGVRGRFRQGGGWPLFLVADSGKCVRGAAVRNTPPGQRFTAPHGRGGLKT